jgi:DNA-binding transcriptional LysR family regulator
VPAGFEPDIVYETEDVAFKCALVEAGAAVAIMPELLISTAGRRAHCADLSPPVPPRTIWAVHRASARELPSVRATVEALTQSP